MTKDELYRLIKIGKVPITIDCRVVYNGIFRMSDYHTYYIGDLYWRGIYSRNISPESTDQELREYILSNI